MSTLAELNREASQQGDAPGSLGDMIARATPEPGDTWPYVASANGNMRDALPDVFSQQRWDKLQSTVEDPQGFNDQFVAASFMSSVLPVKPDYARGNDQLARALFRKQMTPGQVVSQALTNEDMIGRFATSWNSLVRSQKPTEPPAFWEEMVNRAASGLAAVGSAAAESARRATERGEPGLFLAPPITFTQATRDRDAAAAEEFRKSSRLLWEIAQDPELAAQRDDVLSKVLGLGAQTIPYITATTAATIVAGPLGGFAVGYMVEGNSAYQTAIDDGVPEDQARMIGMAVGTVSGAIESIGGRAADKLLEAVTNKIKTRLVRTGASLTLGSLTEALEEAGQEVAAITGESVYKDTDWDQAVRRTLASAGGGALLGGMFRTAGGAIRGVTALSPQAQQVRALRFAAARGELTEEMVTQVETMAQEVAPPAEAPAAEPARAPETPPAAITPEEGAVVPLAEKQPWEMTRDEYREAGIVEPKPNDAMTIDIEGRSIEVIQNPTASDTRQLSKEVREEFPGMPVGDVKIRSTQDAKGNRYIWKANEATHEAVEPALGRAVGEELGQNLERLSHRRVIQQAVSEGETVPRNVLEEYKGQEWADEALAKLPTAAVTPAEEVAVLEAAEPAAAWFHGTHSNIDEFQNREIEGIDTFGTWATGDPKQTGVLYGPNQYQVDVEPQNLLEAHTDNFDEFFFSNENLFSQLFPDADVNLLREFKGKAGALRTENPTLWNMRQEYLRGFRAMLEDAGYDGVIWKQSRIDLQKGDSPHDVAVFFHAEPLAAIPTAPTAAAEAVTPAEVPAVPEEGVVPPTVEPEAVVGEPERRVSRAAQRVQEEAIAKDLTESLGDLPTYERMSMEDQARMAAEEISRDYENAKRMAYGQVDPPSGLRPASIYRAVAVKARDEGDVETLRNLAVVHPAISEELTALGQAIKAADVGIQGDPVRAIRDVAKKREKVVSKRKKIKDVPARKRAMAKDAKSAIRKQTNRRQNWNEFVDSIRC